MPVEKRRRDNEDFAAVQVKPRNFKTAKDEIAKDDLIYAHVNIAGEELDLPAEVLDVREQSECLFSC